MRFHNVLKCKHILKIQQILISIGIYIKITLFCSKTSQKAPRATLVRPRTTKSIFSSCQDMKTTFQEKEFLSYLPQEKSWSDHSTLMAAILVFCRFGCRLHGKMIGTQLKINKYICPVAPPLILFRFKQTKDKIQFQQFLKMTLSYLNQLD